MYSLIHKNFENGTKNPKDMDKYENSQKPAIKQYNYNRCYPQNDGKFNLDILTYKYFLNGTKNTRDRAKMFKNKLSQKPAYKPCMHCS